MSLRERLASLRRHALVRHPVFPLLVFVLVSAILPEFYPLSPFSMYSNPSSEPLRLVYLADGRGEPLGMETHARRAPSAITKAYRKERFELYDKLPGGEPKTGSPADMEVRRIAGEDTLTYLRERSLTRDHPLTGEISLIELIISAERKGLHEEHLAVARLPALETKAAVESNKTEGNQP